MSLYKFKFEPHPDDDRPLDKKIGHDINLQVDTVCHQLEMLRECRGMSYDAHSAEKSYLKLCLEMDEPRTEARLSDIIAYIAAMGGELKIFVEFGDGETEEIL